MFRKTFLALMIASLWQGYVQGAVSEFEPDDDPAQSNPLPATDEEVGQLKSASDVDWYSVDVAPGHAVTPVYFGCNLGTLDDVYDGDCAKPPEREASWQISYYGPDSLAVPKSTYWVNKTSCKQGRADIKGPFRFQMNSEAPGRYFVKVTGIVTSCSAQSPPPQSIYTNLANTSDYTLRAVTTKVTGESEPNDGMPEATTLTNDAAITGQMSSMYDQDWYILDYGGDANHPATTPVYFNCKGAQLGAYFLLAWFDSQGNLQSNYEITAPECSVDGGYKFVMNTPISDRYYVGVFPPTYLSGTVGVGGTNPTGDYANATEFSSHDYILSTFLDLEHSPDVNPGSVQGTVKKAVVVDSPNPAKDRFSVVLRNCGTSRGVVNLSGRNVDLVQQAQNLQFKLNVGGWSCVSDSVESAMTNPAPGKTRYVYPVPVAAPPAKNPPPSTGSGGGTTKKCKPIECLNTGGQ